MQVFINKLRIVLFLIGISPLISSSLIAQEIPLKGPIPFEVLDKDSSGFISKSEFNEAHTERMKKRAEQGLPMRNAGNAPKFSFFDVDKNGKISKTELTKGQDRQMLKNRAQRSIQKRPKGRDIPTFKNFDLDGDGYLKGDEMEKARAKRAEKRASEGKMLRNFGNRATFSEIDANGDGKITEDEFLSHQKSRRR